MHLIILLVKVFAKKIRYQFLLVSSYKTSTIVWTRQFTIFLQVYVNFRKQQFHILLFFLNLFIWNTSRLSWLYTERAEATWKSVNQIGCVPSGRWLQETAYFKTACHSYPRILNDPKSIKMIWITSKRKTSENWEVKRRTEGKRWDITFSTFPLRTTSLALGVLWVYPAADSMVFCE